VYGRVIRELRRAYDGSVSEREAKSEAPWKAEERQAFLRLLHCEHKTRLLDIGAGTGVHGMYFQQRGLQVVCTDLSPAMVRCCQRKGLEAFAMDFLNLAFPRGSFDAVFAMNCLLHVPAADLPAVLDAIDGLLRSDGLFYWGQYGGIDSEGVWPQDHYEPKRFFRLMTDDQIRTLAAERFEVVSFQRIEVERDTGMHFQSLALRKVPGASMSSASGGAGSPA